MLHARRGVIANKSRVRGIARREATGDLNEGERSHNLQVVDLVDLVDGIGGMSRRRRDSNGRKCSGGRCVPILLARACWRARRVLIDMTKRRSYVDMRFPCGT